MITKINKIKNLGIFSNYSPITNLRDFKKYNVIYGWNGSGKTTFSKLFNTLETGSHSDFPSIEFEVQDEAGDKTQQGHPFKQKIRVFNQDYVDSNLQIRNGKTKSITLVLGNTSKEVVEQLEKDELELIQKTTNLEKEKLYLRNKELNKGRIFTEIAKNIFIAITGGAARTYRKDNAESDFAMLASKKMLNEEALEVLAITVKQVQKPLIEPIRGVEIEIIKGELKIKLETVTNDLINKVKSILRTKVESVVIEKLRDNQDISDWVETGLQINTKHNSLNCEFCDQKIPLLRMQELARHFNDADRYLKKEIDDTLLKLALLKEGIISKRDIPDVARFYDELSDNYKKASLNFLTFFDELLINLEKVRVVLKEKKIKTSEEVLFEILLHVDEFNQAIEQLNSFILLHNKKTSDFETAKKNAITEIKTHYLSTIFDEVKTIEQEIKDHQSQIATLTEGTSQIVGITELKKRIAEARAKISSTHKACGDINNGLDTFLGRRELFFEPHKIKSINESGQEIEIEDGYIITRNNELVTHLSEGEKTAIAFVYFTIHLNEASFDKKNGIIVVDDPISSLDANSMFQAFSFLKNSVKNANQLFILTHNFDFLKLILNWINTRFIPDSEKSFYMIKNKDVSNTRIALLDQLDKDLIKHPTEYNYLFKRLYHFESDGTIESVYNIPNIARKVLETFLMFRVPNNETVYEKMESLKGLFDENKLTAIYKFTNDQSHTSGKGFDPSLVPETQKVVKYLFQFIEATFPEHYKVLTT